MKLCQYCHFTIDGPLHADNPTCQERERNALRAWREVGYACLTDDEKRVLDQFWSA